MALRINVNAGWKLAASRKRPTISSPSTAMSVSSGTGTTKRLDWIRACAVRDDACRRAAALAGGGRAGAAAPPSTVMGSLRSRTAALLASLAVAVARLFGGLVLPRLGTVGVAFATPAPATSFVSFEHGRERARHPRGDQAHSGRPQPF